MAIKLSNALGLSVEEFNEQNIINNVKLKDIYEKNPSYNHNPVLPASQIVYEKEFHFLDETLGKKEERRIKKQ